MQTQNIKSLFKMLPLSTLNKNCQDYQLVQIYLKTGRSNVELTYIPLSLQINSSMSAEIISMQKPDI